MTSRRAKSCLGVVGVIGTLAASAIFYLEFEVGDSKPLRIIASSAGVASLSLAIYGFART
jgi:hypothetical protein